MFQMNTVIASQQNFIAREFGLVAQQNDYALLPVEEREINYPPGIQHDSFHLEHI